MNQPMISIARNGDWRVAPRRGTVPLLLEPGQTTNIKKEQTMKQRVYGFKVLAAVLAALTLNGPAIAGKLVPFKGKSSGVITTVGFDPVNGIVYTHASGEGEATLLGRFSVTGDVAIHLATGVLGTWTLTAANRDMLFLTMKGGGIDPTHGFGTFIIVGGTGRFQGATGYYEQIITFGAPPCTTVVSYTDVLEGAISFGPR